MICPNCNHGMELRPDEKTAWCSWCGYRKIVNEEIKKEIDCEKFVNVEDLIE